MMDTSLVSVRGSSEDKFPKYQILALLSGHPTSPPPSLSLSLSLSLVLVHLAVSGICLREEWRHVFQILDISLTICANFFLPRCKITELWLTGRFTIKFIYSYVYSVIMTICMIVYYFLWDEKRFASKGKQKYTILFIRKGGGDYTQRMWITHPDYLLHYPHRYTPFNQNDPRSTNISP